MTPLPLRPPRAAEALVKWLLRDEPWRDTTLGDLREELANAFAQDGPRQARRWYWRETRNLFSDRIHETWRSFRTRSVIQKDSLMRTLVSEFRVAARALWRQPLVSAVVVATLALGLGANAATFGMIDALLLRPFTIPNVDRLVVLAELSAQDPYPQEAVSAGNYLDLRQDPPAAFTRMTTVGWGDVNLSGTDRPERVQGSRVGAAFFAMLGATPADGRFFDAKDEAEGAARTVVISDGLWKDRFGGANVMGSTVQINGLAYTIIGRAPAAFDFPNGSDLWRVSIFDAADQNDRANKSLTVVAELAPGATLEQAQAQAAVRYQRLQALAPDANRVYTLKVFPFTKAMVDIGMPTVLGLWQAAALLLLLIAGTNIANLLLARGAERQRELAVRLAIGAGRARIVRQMLVESIVLALVAIPAALLVAWGSIALLRGMMPAELIRFVAGWTTMGVTPRVAVMTALAALATALLFGLLPALQSSKPQLTASLKDGGRSATAGVGRSRLRRGLVVAEIAIALPLLIASGLAAVAGHRMASGPQGYDPDNVVKVRLDLPEATYPNAEARRQFTLRLLDEAQRVTGMQVATTTVAPAASSNQRRQVVVDGRPGDPDGPRWINYRGITGGYFDVMKIPILEGRAISTQDRNGTEPVAMVSRALAQLYWPDQSPIGKRVKLTTDATEWVTVVGVCGDVLDDWFNARNAPTLYAPVLQWPSSQVFLLARTQGDPDQGLETLRGVVARVDAGLPPFDPATMRQAIHTRTTGLRFVGQLMAAFGALALLLSAAGIYSVMAHYVAQRRHEIGVRMALGATTRDVLKLTVGSGLKLAGFGIVIGLGLGLGAAKFIEGALFGVVALEPMLFVAITALLTMVALVATLLPARHAISVDPAGALRD
ncbi:MAG TPA: ADOP family duplicated permease [Vicinamibacterales bacterium]|nr:ADOP family duplicated permease [Vicinamibacterales bacterium]